MRVNGYLRQPLRLQKFIPNRIILLGVLGSSLLIPASTLATSPAPTLIAPALPPASPLAEGLADRLLAQADANIVDVAQASGFQTFLLMMEELGMLEDLRGYGRFTVFMPTDEAFAAIPASVLESLFADREVLADVLAYHIVVGAEPMTLEEFDFPQTLRTLERGEIEVRRSRGNVYVNDAQIIEPDLEATNGVIHGIDRVLIPVEVLRQLQ